jgi:hypothetical protein
VTDGRQNIVGRAIDREYRYRVKSTYSGGYVVVHGEYEYLTRVGAKKAFREAKTATSRGTPIRVELQRVALKWETIETKGS